MSALSAAGRTASPVALTREALPELAAVTVVIGVAVLLWTAVPRLGNVAWVYDNIEYERYAQTLDTQGRLPTKAENYEYSLPPGQPALAVGLERAARWLGPTDVRPAAGLPRAVRAVLWLVIALGAAWLLQARAGARARTAGFVLALLAAALAALDVVSAATSVAWVPGLLPSIAAVTGLVVVSALLAREVWPASRWAPALAAFGTALLPVVFRIGTVFHPDPLFALLSATALLVAVGASRRGWTVRRGLACGALLALAALTRQSAVLVMVAVAAIALLLDRRSTLRFLVAAAAVVALVAGPWWGYQASRYGNPIQSNLNRPGLMLRHEPLSFFVDVPGAIVTRPWSLVGRNLLFPKFHVSLWSDWSGIGDFGGPYGSSAKALASSQSVLGFGGDALVLGALVALGVPALLRVARGRTREQADRVLAALTVFFVLSWAAFLTMLLRFPQRDADPNSPHYLVFLAPAAVALGLAAARVLWQRRGVARAAVAAWALLYAVSWGWVLAILV